MKVRGRICEEAMHRNPRTDCWLLLTLALLSLVLVRAWSEVVVVGWLVVGFWFCCTAGYGDYLYDGKNSVMKIGKLAETKKCYLLIQGKSAVEINYHSPTSHVSHTIS